MAIGSDGTVVSAYVSDGPGSYAMYGAYGLLNNNDSTPTFTFFGTDSDFDSGEAPASVAIDPNGLAVSIHETSHVGSTTMWVNIGTAKGGQGGLKAANSIDINICGQNPSIVAIGPGEFLVAAQVVNVGLTPLVLSLWTMTVTQVNGQWTVNTAPISINATALGSAFPGGLCVDESMPQLAYANGVLAIADLTNGGVLGTLNGNVYTAETYWNGVCELAGAHTELYPEQVATLGPNNTIYFGQIIGASPNWIINYQTGTYTTGSNWSVNFTTNTNLFVNQLNLPANYPRALDMVYTQANGLNGVVMAVLSYCGCIDLFYIPA